jgi:hypothetical protein
MSGFCFSTLASVSTVGSRQHPSHADAVHVRRADGGQPGICQHVQHDVSHSWRYYNTLDAIPNGFATLAAIKELYPLPGPKCPWELADAIDFVNYLLNTAGVSYVQTNDNGKPLPGKVSDSGADFLSEMSIQHGHNTYLSLLGAPILPFIVQTIRVLSRI